MKNILVIAVLLITFSVSGQATGSIKGQVTEMEAEGQAIPFAYIALDNEESITHTNFHGNFEFQDVSAGEHLIEIHYAGYVSQKIKVIVTENKEAMVNTHLELITIDTSDLGSALNTETPKE